jgi:16S rRNA (cytidine1402-2'-O)-methyltransferase
VAHPSRPGAETSSVAERAAQVLANLMAEPLPGGLYVVATPIGNLADITLRALAALARADVVYCEDTRHSRTLLTHFGITRQTRPYHEHNAERERPHVLAELAAGKSVAIISDAGTPLISDPGYKIVRAAAAAGHPAFCLPGASAVIAALVSSGLPTDAFMFAGFLPPKQKARAERLSELSGVPATLIFFEAPSRLADSLGDVANVLGERPVAVARELTKLHEEVKTGPASELAQWAAQDARKGEMVVLVAPPDAKVISDETIADRLGALLGQMSVRDAAKAVADELGVSKARAYDLALGLKRRDGD